jgi:hypothetical protein
MITIELGSSFCKGIGREFVRRMEALSVLTNY